MHEYHAIQQFSIQSSCVMQVIWNYGYLHNSECMEAGLEVSSVVLPVWQYQWYVIN